jgi:hypothetical protein
MFSQERDDASPDRHADQPWPGLQHIVILRCLACPETAARSAGRTVLLFDSISRLLAPNLPFCFNILKFIGKPPKFPAPHQGGQSRLRGICLESSPLFSYYDFNHTASHIFLAWFDPCFPVLTVSDAPCPNGPIPGRLR